MQDTEDFQSSLKSNASSNGARSSLGVTFSDSDPEVDNALETELAVMSLNVEDDQEDREDILDEFCDPENPKSLTFQDVSAASFKIKKGVVRTECSVSSVQFK